MDDAGSRSVAAMTLVTQASADVGCEIRCVRWLVASVDDTNQESDEGFIQAKIRYEWTRKVSLAQESEEGPAAHQSQTRKQRFWKKECGDDGDGSIDVCSLCIRLALNLQSMTS